jgi:hypothetical protein
MDMEQNAQDAERRGVPTFAVEAAVALMVLVLGLVVVFGSRKLGSAGPATAPAPATSPSTSA